MALNVLIVDDSDVIRAMIARTLTLAQIPLGEVYQAANGREALSMLDESWVDLVLADINMPVMSGAEMLERMRANPRTADVPVVVVSTEGATKRIESLMRLGVAAWIRKPFTPEEIRDAVTKVMMEAETRAAGTQLLDDALGLVLEQFAFAFPDAVAADDLPHAGDDVLVARISFVGAAAGSLTLAAPTGLCAELASNILGVDPEESAHVCGGDALGEILNMTCGHIATSLDADRPTDIQPPIVTRLSATEWDRLARSSGARTYMVEDQPLLALLGLRTNPAQCLTA